MRRWLLWLEIGWVITAYAGCAHYSSRAGVISEELPLTVDDLTEIRDGKRNHERVLWEYRVYHNDHLTAYCNNIARNIAAVSERPSLPYQVILLDSDEVNVFGGPGGYIYVTRGFFDFVSSETELAGALAHEIVHVANYQYSNIPHLTRIQQAYNLAVQGTELAKSSIGTYGTAASLGLKGIGKAAPVIARRFGKDEEIVTDNKAVDVLYKAGYDPRGYLKLVDKLTRIDIDHIDTYAIYVSTHPPFADRRVLLEKKVAGMKLDNPNVNITIREDHSLSEIRQTEAATVKKTDSIIFKPNMGNQSPLH